MNGHAQNPEASCEPSPLKHYIVAYDPRKWCAVPANNGGSGPTWQWGGEILVGYSQDEGRFDAPGYIHQRVARTGADKLRFDARLARSRDGGKTWTTWPLAEPAGAARALAAGIDWTAPGFAMRVGRNLPPGQAPRWSYSLDRGATWLGPHPFAGLMEHPELEGRSFTGRTAYIADAPGRALLFLSAGARRGDSAEDESNRVFVAETRDGGETFAFVAWVVPWSDPHREAMPSPVRLSGEKLVVALRRADRAGDCRIDCAYSLDNGRRWAFLSRVAGTGCNQGNPPALLRLADGRLCCAVGHRERRVMLALYSEDEGRTWPVEQVFRDDFQSVNGQPDLGYPRLFQRPDGNLAAVYFWCAPGKPQTHIAATVFKPAERYPDRRFNP
jgi:hypothetical protein